MMKSKDKISPSLYTSIPIYNYDPPKKKYSGVAVQNQNRMQYYSFRQHIFSSKSIIARLLFSFLPPLGPFKQPHLDLEGTALSIFLLKAVLFSRVGKNGFTFPIALPLLYVTLFASFIFLVGKITKSTVSFREMFCLCGYGLFGGTITLLLTQVSDRLFFPSLIIFCGLSSLRITITLFFRTRIPALRFLLGTPAAVIHSLFPVYLHYVTKL